MRRLLPEGVVMYTGDDFNYAELMAGDERASRTACSASSIRSPRPPPRRSTGWRRRPGGLRRHPGAHRRPVAPTLRGTDASTSAASCSSPGSTVSRPHFRMVGGAEFGPRHSALRRSLPPRRQCRPSQDPDLAAARMGPAVQDRTGRFVRREPTRDAPQHPLHHRDHGAATASRYAGHPRVRTPNLDALAAEGIAFLRHYGQATPCSPARACLYTGPLPDDDAGRPQWDAARRPP